MMQAPSKRAPNIFLFSTFVLYIFCGLSLLLTACEDRLMKPPRVQGRPIYGIDTANNLVRFGSQRPDSVMRKKISGLNPGETIAGIDFRPVDNRLYAISSFSQLYVLDTLSGTAVPVGPSALPTLLSGTYFGFGFNPVPDKIRIHSNAEQDLRLDPDIGSLAIDSTLAYDSGDAYFNVNPNIVGTAYTNSVPGAASTTLFAIDSNLDVLVILPIPNNGRLQTIGSLGVNTNDLVGFDISGKDVMAFASLTINPAGGSSFYAIDLSTGAATLIGALGNGATLNSLAIAP